MNTAKKSKIVRPTKNRDLSKLKNTKTSSKKKAVKSNLPKSVLSKIASNRSPSKTNKPKNITAKTIKLAAKTTTIAPKKSKHPLWIAVYALTISIGLSTILGTTIAIANSFSAPVISASDRPNKVQNQQNKAKLEQLLSFATLGQEIKPLKTQLETLAQKYPELQPEIFLVDLDSKGFVDIRGQTEISSASTIKLPVLVAFFQDVDRGKIRLDERLTMTKDLVAGGSGDMQHEKPGKQFSALETATKMIVISDNTATNMLIERLGGKEELNRRFLAMGLTKTKLRNPLPDLTGTNTTSPKDLSNLLIKIDRGGLLSSRSRDRLLHIMSSVEKDTLLPHGLEAGALIAHKTGDIKSMLADVGAIDMPNGKRYIASILVKRPDNAPEAEKFIQQASATVYQYFKTPQSDTTN